MAFLTYNKFVENKNQNNKTIIFDISEYRDAVYADLSRLVLNKTDYFEEAITYLLNINKIECMLHDLGYPHKEAICIALKSGNDEKIVRNMNKLENWLDFCGFSKQKCALIERACFDYRSKKINNNFEPSDVDVATENLVTDCYHFLESIKSKFEAILPNTDLDEVYIVLEAMPASKNLKIKIVKCKLKCKGEMQVEITRTDEGFIVGEATFENMPSSIKEKLSVLLSKLKESEKYNKILTLYLQEPNHKRFIYENKKLDISLGIQTTLPKNCILATTPMESNDVWKVRLHSNNLVKIMQEGDVVTYRLLDESRLLWIERLES